MRNDGEKKAKPANQPNLEALEQLANATDMDVGPTKAPDKSVPNASKASPDYAALPNIAELAAQIAQGNPASLPNPPAEEYAIIDIRKIERQQKQQELAEKRTNDEKDLKAPYAPGVDQNMSFGPKDLKQAHKAQQSPDDPRILIKNTRKEGTADYGVIPSKEFMQQQSQASQISTKAKPSTAEYGSWGDLNQVAAQNKGSESEPKKPTRPVPNLIMEFPAKPERAAPSPGVDKLSAAKQDPMISALTNEMKNSLTSPKQAASEKTSFAAQVEARRNPTNVTHSVGRHT